MQALLERQRHAQNNLPPPQVSTPKNNAWKNTEDPSMPWLKLGVTLLLLVALFWMGSQGKNNGLPKLPASPVAPVSFEFSGVLVGTVIGSVLFTLLLMGARKLLRRAAPVQGGATETGAAAACTACHARSTQARHLASLVDPPDPPFAPVRVVWKASGRLYAAHAGDVRKRRSGRSPAPRHSSGQWAKQR